MPVQFLGQPFDVSHQIGTRLREALADDTMTRFWLATAWAKRSGLSRLWAAVSAFRDRGGDIEAIVGIDEGGATKEGLEACLQLFDRTWILKDKSGRTFHPKLYVVENDVRARVIVGSGNLTRGGLFTNFEAAVLLDAFADVEADWQLRDAVRDYYDRLLGLDGAIKPLDAELIEQLVADGYVFSETRQARRRARVRAEQAGTTLFEAVAGLADAPAADVEALPQEEADDDSVIEPDLIAAEEVEAEQEEEEEELERAEVGGLPGAVGTLGFWKALSRSDASRTSSPGQIIIPRRFADFFPERQVEIDETATGGPRQSSAHFALEFVDGTWRRGVADARIVLYEPATYHPRPNIELRFTFRDPEVFSRLAPNDILTFTRRDGAISVERRPPGSRALAASGRFSSRRHYAL